MFTQWSSLCSFCIVRFYWDSLTARDTIVWLSLTMGFVTSRVDTCKARAIQPIVKLILSSPLQLCKAWAIQINVFCKWYSLIDLCETTVVSIDIMHLKILKMSLTIMGSNLYNSEHRAGKNGKSISFHGAPFSRNSIYFYTLLRPVSPSQPATSAYTQLHLTTQNWCIERA